MKQRRPRDQYALPDSYVAQRNGLKFLEDAVGALKKGIEFEMTAPSIAAGVAS